MEAAAVDNSLINDVDNFVKELISGYKPQKITERKVIHDPILGSNIFEPHEVALIDSPFVQRLRRISQTDVAALVYPSANSTRFEHTLGVTTIAGRILDSLLLKSKPDTKDILSSPIARKEVRFAAILHDIGHGVFSHLSEDTIKRLPEVISQFKQNPGKFSSEKPHEMISYLMVKSPTFQKYFEEYIVKGQGLESGISLDRIANSIIPAGENDEMYGWQAQIINGPFDADKFDYLQRDAYFSGLKIGIDLDRFLHCVWFDGSPGKPRQLKIMTSGATTLEQILFGKMLLYTTIYHHHKILSAECAIKAILELSREHKICGRNMNRAMDFLYITENDILSLDGKSDKLKSYISNFLNRKLLKRALVISADTVIDPSTSPGYLSFKKLTEYPEKRRELVDELIKKLSEKYDRCDIWIDIPQTLTFEDAFLASIEDENNVSRYFPETLRISNWLSAYEINKWKGYVFCPPQKAVREEVGKKAAELITGTYDFKFDLEKALGQAKIR
ncbi:MAG: HD domain-containing protein [Dehalococcoidia bacterium]